MKKFRQTSEDTEMEEQWSTEEESPFEPFLTEGLITEVVRTVKSGKEATVYCCRGGSDTGAELVAVKVYRSREHRNFKNDVMYQEGRVILNGHTARAVKKKTRFGRLAGAAMWTCYEFEALKILYKAGADVPRPYVQRGDAILIEYLGDLQGPAPLLQNVELEPAEVSPLFEKILANVELFLKLNFVHGDLSAFNILYWEGQLKIIDFPQVVDPRFNSHAFMLLKRDLENICNYWARYGVQADSAQIAQSLWHRFKNSQL